MKQILFYLFTLVMLIFTGCEKDESTPELPDAAGAITMVVQDDGNVMLSIPSIANAKTYHWYLNNDIVQNTSDTSYLANVAGIYRVTGVNSANKEGAASSPVSVVVGLPGGVGEISQAIQSDGYVMLSIDEVSRATKYRWYKGDKEVQNSNSRTFLATESGSYRVAGVNDVGEGAHSEPSLVELNIFNILTEEYIPSQAFRNWVKENIAGGGDVLTNYQAAAYSGKIDIASLKSENLKGIEFFTSLDKLICSVNLLAELDISKNVNLTYLDCSSNSLTALDISQLTKLDTLIVASNSIKSLDFSGCKESLITLAWALNKLTVAEFAANNVKSLTNLRTLDLHYNLFSDDVLDLSGMNNVQILELTNCKLTGINIGGFSSLKRLIIGTNSLTSLDLSGCPVLEELYCQTNKNLSVLDIDHLTATLRVLNFSTCKVTYKDLSAFTKLEKVECFSNPWVGALDFSKCPDLIKLRCENMGISELNISTCTKLQELYAYGNNLTGLDLSGFTNLTTLYAYKNKLTSLNVSGCTVLKNLSVYTNQLTSIDVSTNTGLTGLNCSTNNLTRLDISNNSALISFLCTTNPNLLQIKVWSTFSMDSPPSGFYKPSTAAYVYEFTN